jgi:hypothetical protein
MQTTYYISAAYIPDLVGEIDKIKTECKRWGHEAENLALTITTPVWDERGSEYHSIVSVARAVGVHS